ncbi:hypothetical protein Tco_0981075, partial [Tanacetum coccineum]
MNSSTCPNCAVELGMVVVRFHCPFVGLSGCHDGGGNGLTKTSLITHLRDRHCNGDAQAITRQSLSTNLVVFEEAEFVRFVLYVALPNLTFPSSSEHLDQRLRTVKSIPLKCRLGFSRVLKEALDKSAIKHQLQEESIVNATRSWSLPGGSLQVMRETLAESSPPLSDVDKEDIDLDEWNIKQCKRKICDGHYTAAVRVLSSSGVAPYNDATLEDLKTKHPFKPPLSLPHISIDHHYLVASPAVVLDIIKSFPRGTSCWRDGLCAQHLMDCLSGAAVVISDELVSFITQVVNLFLDGKCPNTLGEYIVSAHLTPLVKPRGGIHPIAMGTVWRRLVSKVSATMIGHS